MFRGQGLSQTTGHRKYHGVMPPHKAVILGNFEIIETAKVDGETWYTVQVIPHVTKWIKIQNSDMWYEHHTTHNFKVLDTFDIQKKLYTLLILAWGER